MRHKDIPLNERIIFALDVDSEESVGMGTGAVGALLERKKQVVKDAVSFHRKEWTGSPLEALQRVGGFEIAGMTGMIFGGACHGIPVVVDGFVASAAALVAIRMEPEVRSYLFFAHASAEKYHETFLRKEGINPLLSLNMRLGEGKGAVLAMHRAWKFGFDKPIFIQVYPESFGCFL